MSEFSFELPAWADRILDSLLATWELLPLEQRWTLGTIVVVTLVLSRWLLPAIAGVVRAFRGGGS